MGYEITILEYHDIAKLPTLKVLNLGEFRISQPY